MRQICIGETPCQVGEICSVGLQFTKWNYPRSTGVLSQRPRDPQRWSPAIRQLQATPCYLRYKAVDFMSPLEGPVLLRCAGNVFIVPKHRVLLSTHFTSLGVEPLGKLVVCRVRQITLQENRIANAISCVCTRVYVRVCVYMCVCLCMCLCMCLCVGQRSTLGDFNCPSPSLLYFHGPGSLTESGPHWSW